MSKQGHLSELIRDLKVAHRSVDHHKNRVHTVARQREARIDDELASSPRPANRTTIPHNSSESTRDEVIRGPARPIIAAATPAPSAVVASGPSVGSGQEQNKMEMVALADDVLTPRWNATLKDGQDWPPYDTVFKNPPRSYAIACGVGAGTSLIATIASTILINR